MKGTKNIIKIIILGVIAILVAGFGINKIAEAASPSVYISPPSLDKKVGDTFNISVIINPSGQKACVVEGKLNLNKLTCQKVTIGSGISAQTSPSCDNLSFLLGIQGCTTSSKTLFTVTVKAKNADVGTANFTGVDIIGEGVSISSASSGGSYTITSTPSCNCSVWNSWQNGTCGAGNCSSTQRLQTHTRACTPSSCNIESESRCISDSNCILPLPSLETGDKEEIVEKPSQESKEIVGEPAAEEKIPQKGLLASLAIALEEITQSTFLAIVVTVCLMGLIEIGVREGWLFLKKKKKFREK